MIKPISTALKEAILNQAKQLRDIAYGREHGNEGLSEYGVYIDDRGRVYANGLALRNITDGECVRAEDLPLWVLVSLMENGKPLKEWAELGKRSGYTHWAPEAMLDDIELIDSKKEDAASRIGIKNR